MPSIDVSDRHVSWRRLLAGGIVATALIAVCGGALELWWFGASNAAAGQRAEREILQRFDAMVRAITRVSERVGGNPAAVTGLNASTDNAKPLFDLVREARLVSEAADQIAVTIYDQAIVARAWAGAPSDIPNDRISESSTLFVTPSPLGLRLVHLRPIVDGQGTRLGAVATEHVLSPASAATTLTPTDYTLETNLAPAYLRITRFEGAGDLTRPGVVVLRAPEGEPLAEAWVDPEALAASRARWRRTYLATVIAAAGVTMLLFIGPLLDRRIGATERVYWNSTVTACALVCTGGLLLWAAFAVAARGSTATPLTLLIAGGTAAALVSLLAGPVSRLRSARRHHPVLRTPSAAWVVTQLAAGTAVALLVILFYRRLGVVIDPASVDLRHFSLHPWRLSRIVVLMAIVAMQLAVLWAATLALLTAGTHWRVPRGTLRLRGLMLVLWLTPAVVAAFIGAARQWPLPALGLLLSTGGCALAAMVGSRISSGYRRATVAARILALFLAFLIPTLLLYPAMNYLAERATRELIAREYAVQAQNHGQTLLRYTEQARREVDANEALPDLVNVEVPEDPPPSDAAFLVWRQTALGRQRLTSAVELYNRSGKLVSRFPLNIPEYSAAAVQSSAGCEWDVFVEVVAFGSEERRMLHAERRICTVDAAGVRSQQGAVILHVLFEYETLPFITSQNPYYEVVRATGEPDKEGTPGGSVEVAIYGWGLQPMYTSGRSAWPITDTLFAKLYASREPFWAEAVAGGARHQVYFSNDRERIFAIGYPVLTVFDHFVHLAELATFGGAAFLVVLIGTALFTRISRQRPRVGRALLREIRASFYRKLFLAFVLAAIIPVLTLALVIRTYFATLLQADVEGRGGPHRGHRAARHRGSRHRPAPQRRNHRHAQRRLDGLDQPGHRSGRQRVPRRKARGDVRTRAVRVRRAADAHARRHLPRHRPRAASELRPRGCGRIVQLHARRRAGARRRPGRARHGTPHPSPAGDRAGDRRARSRRPSRLAVLRAGRRRHRLVDGRAHRRSGAPPDPRNRAHRAWRL